MARLSPVTWIVPANRRSAARLLASSILCALVLVSTSTLAGASPSKASSATISAHLTKKSFTSSQARSVKLIYKFSATSKTFAYKLTFKKGSKWLKVKSVKKKGTFKGSKSMTVKKVFAGKSVKVGSYRLKLSADGGSKLLKFKVVKAKSGGSTPTGSKPTNSSLPTISGTTTQGQTLTASNGSWSNSPTSYARQWRRCDSSGASCSDLSSATYGTYVLVVADVGSTIRIVVTASNSYGSASATSSQTAVVAGLPPTNTALPAISGTTTQGQTLSASNGSWNNSPTSHAYQWRRCDGSGASCSDISGATSISYVLDTGDVGSTIRVVITASNSYGSASATSSQTAVVVGLPPTGSAPVNTALPTISGATTQGQTLSASNGSWTTSPTSYAYQWRRCDSSGASCSDISGATSGSYLLVLADVGSTIRVVVTASNSYGSGSATSGQTSTILGLTPANTSIPTISGTATEYDALFADPGSWSNSPDSFSYQWKRCNSSGNDCLAISGATANTHTLSPADVGYTIRVVVTASNAFSSNNAISDSTEVIAAAPPTTLGASGWAWQNPLPQGNDLNGVDFVNTNDGWAVGRKGTILSTADGGVSWSVSARVTDEDLTGVSFVNSTHGWVVGSLGTILATSDGGVNWTEQDSTSACSLVGVVFIDVSHGWAIGQDPDTGAGVVLSTNDGGAHWSEQYSSTYSINSIDFVDANHGWITGSHYDGSTDTASGAVYQTSDGGIHWSEVVSGESYYNTSLDFIDASHGWLIRDLGGYSVVLSTTDGGAHWSQVYTTLTGDCQPNSDLNGCNELAGDVQFISPTKGWVENATTSDGGAHWTFQTIDSPQNMSAMRFIDADHGWAVGSGGAIMATSDGGSTWSEQSNGTKYELDGVSFADLNSGWAVGSYYDYSSDSRRAVILATSGGGANWSEQFTLAGGGWISFSSVFSVDSKHAWAVCDGDDSETLYATSDGSNWSQIYSGDYQIGKVKFLDANNGWAIASKPGDQTFEDAFFILRTSNGGRNWSEVYQGSYSSENDDSFQSLDVIDSSHVWAIGTRSYHNEYGNWFGSIVTYSSNGGITWDTKQIGGYGGIAIDFTDNLHGWAVEDTGVCETSDGGGTWDCGNFGFPGNSFGYEFNVDDFSDVAFLNSNDGWVVGGAGIYATTDGGANWTEQSSINTYSVSFVDTTHGWAAGRDAIISTTTGGFPP